MIFLMIYSGHYIYEFKKVWRFAEENGEIKNLHNFLMAIRNFIVFSLAAKSTFSIDVLNASEIRIWMWIHNDAHMLWSLHFEAFSKPWKCHWHWNNLNVLTSPEKLTNFSSSAFLDWILKCIKWSARSLRCSFKTSTSSKVSSIE